MKRAAPEIKQALDALPCYPGQRKKTLSGMSGGLEIICFAQMLKEAGKQVKVYFIDSMARFKRCNYGEWN
ncbi:MAG TPA: hypothetical protein VH575_05600 [Gemmataceae bacterium]